VNEDWATVLMMLPIKPFELTCGAVAAAASLVTDDRSGRAMTDSSGVAKSSSLSQNDA
jgi:hypothetical protein